MGEFIRSLISAGKVPFYVDFRTGSVCSLSGLAANVAPTIINTPTFTQSFKCKAIKFTLGSLSYANQADQALTQGTWMFLDRRTVLPVGYNWLFSKRDGGGIAYDFYLQDGTISYGNGITSSLAAPKPNRSTLAWRHVNTTIPTAFIDGLAYVVPVAASSIGTATTPIYIGRRFDAFGPTSVPEAAFIVVNEALSDPDVARLHRELVQAPTVVSRPSRHFSIPQPERTPAEYAADVTRVDLLPMLMQNKMKDLSGSGYDATVVGAVDVVKEGPFDTAVEMNRSHSTLPAGFAALLFQNTYTLSSWVRPRLLDNGVHMLLATGSTPYVGRETDDLWHSYRNGAGVQQTDIFANALTIQKWAHVTYQLVNSPPNVTLRFFVDGSKVYEVTRATGFAPVASSAYINVFAPGSAIFDACLASLTYRSSEVSEADIRAEYLKGAHKCLLDARVHADGSCPVTLTPKGAGNEIANGWKVQAGTWNVVEDAPVDGRPGERWLSCQTVAGVVSQLSKSAYGSWYVKWKASGNNFYFGFISSTPNLTNQNGYFIRDFGNVLRVYQVNAGVQSLFLTVTASLLGVTEAWITRRYNGLMQVWVKGGGVYSDWTLVMSGTNAGITSSKYTWMQGENPQTLADGIVSYLGEMTLTEAIELGVLEA